MSGNHTWMTTLLEPVLDIKLASQFSLRFRDHQKLLNAENFTSDTGRIALSVERSHILWTR
jgi:hypothetical protein